MPTKRAVSSWKPGIWVRMRRASGGVMGPVLLQDAVEDAVGEELHALGVADGVLAVGAGRGARSCGGEGVVAEGFGEEVGGGDGVLQGDVDADAADRGHGVGGVADAEQAGEDQRSRWLTWTVRSLTLSQVSISAVRPARKGTMRSRLCAEGGEAVLLDAGKCLWR